MSPDILDRLRDKVMSGTNPKLFIPLSDEYKSLGMTAAAIHVLEHCIEKYPNYMSARVALGNLYMEKGCFIHAIEEFKSVADSIPDNILSHRKLAELYGIIGETQNALLSYRTILSIDPSDEDADAGLQKILNEVRLKEQAEQEAAAEKPDNRVEAISEEPISGTEEATPPAEIDLADEYELAADMDVMDIDDSEETVAIAAELLTDEFTLDEFTPIETESETETISGIEDTAPLDQSDLTDEYELAADIDIIDIDDSEETVAIGAVTLTDEFTPDEFTPIETESETETISVTEEAAPPVKFNPVNEYELPPDIDIDDIDDIEETVGTTAEPLTDAITPDELILIETEEAADTEPVSVVEETAPPAALEHEDEFELPSDIDYGEETVVMKAEPLTGEIIPIDTQEAAETEPISVVEETAPPAALEPEDEYEFDIPDSEDNEGAIELNAEPLSDEIIPIDTISSMSMEADPDFGIKESAPPAPFDPIDEYELPADIDIDDIEDVEGAEVVEPTPLTGEITPDELIPVDTAASAEAEPDFGIEETAPPDPFSPVGKYELSPYIGGVDIIDVIGVDNGEATVVPKLESSTYELPHDEIIPVDTAAATEVEPIFGLEEATPSALFNPVEKYELSPDIDGIDNGEGTVELKVPPLTYISTPESTPIDTIIEAATEAEPDFGLEE
ncbi:MAG: hypothetical protein HQK96_18475, partial [Nitrospirae bacterium]|nr:hypothetical protein [Nitrospirota bacterium]